MNTFDSFSYTPVLRDDGDMAWDWLSGLIGNQAAETVQTIFYIMVYAVVIYILVIQIFRLLNNISNRNAEDPKQRQEARENIKGSVFVILMTVLIGGIGFTALIVFMNTMIPGVADSTHNH